MAYSATEEGTPQGNGASPMLANIYLHYVLDNWFDVIVRRHGHGECYIVRYAVFNTRMTQNGL